MMRRLVFGLLLFPVALPAQQYPFIPVANSPKNIEHILEDRQGRLWVSTHDDVLCFDGVRFYSLHDFGLPAVLSTSLAEDAQGGILIGAYGGVYRFFQGRVQHVFSSKRVDDVIDVAPGVLLAASQTSPERAAEVALYRIRALNGAWQADLLTGWKTGMYLTRDPSGTILAGCPGGWCEMSARLIEDWSPEHPAVPVFHKSEFDMERVLRDRRGCLWFRSTEAVAYQCPDASEPVQLPADIAGRNVWAGEIENEDGSILICECGVAGHRPPRIVPDSFVRKWFAGGLDQLRATIAGRLHLARYPCWAISLPLSISDDVLEEPSRTGLVLCAIRRWNSCGNQRRRGSPE